MIRRAKPRFLIPFLLFFFEVLSFTPVFSRNLPEDEQLIQVSIGAFQDGLYDIAEKQFSLFLKEFPAHGKANDVSYLLARTLLHQEKWTEAKSVLAKIIQENKNLDSMDYVLFWMAQTEMKLGNPEMSQKWLLLLTKNYPRFEYLDYAYYHLGCLGIDLNRFPLAESSLNKVLLLSKRQSLVRGATFWLGVVSLKQKAYEKAILYLKPLWDESRRVSSTDGKDILFWLSEAQFTLGHIREALLDYQTYYNEFRTDPLIPHVYWRMGFCEYLLGNQRESVDRFRSFQSLFKENPLGLYTHYLLGEIFLDLGEHASSIRELNQLLQIPQPHPLWASSLLMLYWNHLHLGSKEDAHRITQRLLKLQSAEDEKSLIQWLMGQSLFAEGRVLDALPYYFGILNSRFRERALFQIAKGYFFENQIREALTNVDLLLLEFPDLKPRDEGLFMKGECLLLLGEGPRALETYGQILQHSGKNPWSLMALTQTAVHDLSLGKEAKAEELFKRVLNEFSNHPLVYHAAFQLGILSERKNDIQGASRFYALVLRENLPALLGPTYFRIGEILIHQEKPDKAFSSFKAALPYLPEDSVWFGITQLEIGNGQRRSGRLDEARKSFELAKNHVKDEQIREAARESLQILAAQ
jgi:tetratricopeptide (TPR) repeat protein